MTRIAYLSPLPPERTGIADYSALLLPELGRRVEVDAYAPGRPHPIAEVRHVRPTRRALRRLGGYDAVIAHMGNSEAHAWIPQALRHAPVTVVLHELVLHHLVAAMTLGRGDRAGYLDAMTQEAGTVGRLLAYAVTDGAVPPLWEVAPERYPLTDIALRDAAGCIVHSRFVADVVRARYPGLPVHVIPHLCVDGPDAPVDRAPGGGTVFGVFGFITRQKRLGTVMRAFRDVAAALPDARLLVVGSAPPGLDPAQLAAAEGVPADRVEGVGYADGAAFDRLLRSIDVGVNLRHPTLGETSGTVIRWMGAGVPVVVSTGGWYDELPDAAVVRVAPDDGEAEELARALVTLGADAALRARMGDAGRDYARRTLAPSRIAERYLAAVLAPRGRAALAAAALPALA
ncbi:MAG: glycosyltransferase family 4 protein, partial [Actinomycetota bacterium]